MSYTTSSPVLEVTLLTTPIHAISPPTIPNPNSTTTSSTTTSSILTKLQLVRTLLARKITPTHSRFYTSSQRPSSHRSHIDNLIQEPLLLQQDDTPNEDVLILGIWDAVQDHVRFLEDEELRNEVLAPQEGVLEWVWGRHVGVTPRLIVGSSGEREGWEGCDDGDDGGGGGGGDGGDWEMRKDGEENEKAKTLTAEKMRSAKVVKVERVTVQQSVVGRFLESVEGGLDGQRGGREGSANRDSSFVIAEGWDVDVNGKARLDEDDRTVEYIRITGFEHVEDSESEESGWIQGQNVATVQSTIEGVVKVGVQMFFNMEGGS